jgi:acetyl-CoA carboxylase carboxyltransferase component
MGPTQLAGVMAIVGRASAESAGRPWDEAEGERLRRSVEEQIDRESSVLFATARIWDDGIVDPRDTRTVLGIALSACHSAEVRGTSGFGVFRM